MRLLIVDDSELMRKVTRLAFRSTAELGEATNGVEALAVLSATRQPWKPKELAAAVELASESRHRRRA